MAVLDRPRVWPGARLDADTPAVGDLITGPQVGDLALDRFGDCPRDIGPAGVDRLILGEKLRPVAGEVLEEVLARAGPEVEDVRPDGRRPRVASGAHHLGHERGPVGQPGQDRRQADARLDPGIDERAQRPQPLSGRRRAGLGAAPDLPVERRDREGHRDLRPTGGPGQDVHVAYDHRPAGDQGDRRPRFAEHDDRAAREPKPSLRRLVWVRGRAHSHGGSLPRRPTDLAAEHVHDVGLDSDRGPVTRVGGAIGDALERADVAERAAMGAAHVRIERPGKGHVADAIQRGPAGLIPILGGHGRGDISTDVLFAGPVAISRPALPCWLFSG